jgi:AcrR family transcriptional regulator
VSVDESTQKRGPGRPRNEAYDNVILDATLAILSEQGYGGLTIDGVAARANVGRPTIYRRWPNKAALVVAALARSTGLAPAPDTGSLRGDLLAVQKHQVKLMNSPGYRRINPGLVADLAGDPDLAQTYLNDYIAPRRRSVWDALDRGIERGELRPDIDHAFISDLLTGPLFYRVLIRGEHLEPDAAERTVDVVLAAYGKRPKRPRRDEARRMPTTAASPR